MRTAGFLTVAVAVALVGCGAAPSSSKDSLPSPLSDTAMIEVSADSELARMLAPGTPAQLFVASEGLDYPAGQAGRWRAEATPATTDEVLALAGLLGVSGEVTDTDDGLGPGLMVGSPPVGADGVDRAVPSAHRPALASPNGSVVQGNTPVSVEEDVGTLQVPERVAEAAHQQRTIGGLQWHLRRQRRLRDVSDGTVHRKRNTNGEATSREVRSESRLRDGRSRGRDRLDADGGCPVPLFVSGKPAFDRHDDLGGSFDHRNRLSC